MFVTYISQDVHHINKLKAIVSFIEFCICRMPIFAQYCFFNRKLIKFDLMFLLNVYYIRPLLNLDCKGKVFPSTGLGGP
jgi:hypothetical protein